MGAEWLFDLAAAHLRCYSFDEVTDETMPKVIVVGIANTIAIETTLPHVIPVSRSRYRNRWGG